MPFARGFTGNSLTLKQQSPPQDPVDETASLCSQGSIKDRYCEQQFGETEAILRQTEVGRNALKLLKADHRKPYYFGSGGGSLALSGFVSLDFNETPEMNAFNIISSVADWTPYYPTLDPDKMSRQEYVDARMNRELDKAEAKVRAALMLKGNPGGQPVHYLIAPEYYYYAAYREAIEAAKARIPPPSQADMESEAHKAGREAQRKSLEETGRGTEKFGTDWAASCNWWERLTSKDC